MKAVAVLKLEFEVQWVWLACFWAFPSMAVLVLSRILQSKTVCNPIL